MEAVRAGNLEAAGFWEISDEIVVFHVAASPAFFHGARQASENVARHRLILNTNDGQNLCVAIIRRATS